MDFTCTGCDVCRTIKKEANHWWSGAIKNGALILVPFEQRSFLPSNPEEAFDLCGHSCVQSKVAQFLSPPDKP